MGLTLDGQSTNFQVPFYSTMLYSLSIYFFHSFSFIAPEKESGLVEEKDATFVSFVEELLVPVLFTSSGWTSFRICMAHFGLWCRLYSALV